MLADKPIRTITVLGLLSLTTVACVYNPPHHASVSYRVHSGYAEPWGYYYYPDAQVYFHFSSGFYYYSVGSTWVRTRFLPKHIHLNPDIRVQLHIESDRPYVFHHQHREKYPGRSRHAPAPTIERREHGHKRDRDERKLRSIEEHRFAPPVHTRPTPRPGYEREQNQHRVVPPVQTRPTPAPKHKREKHQAPIRFDSPPQHKPIPFVPGHEQQCPDPKGRSTHNETDRVLCADRQQKDKHRAKQQQYQEQSEEQEGDNHKRSKKQRREEERQQRYR